MKKHLALGVLGLALMSGAFAAPPVKVEVCHFDEEAAEWVEITIPQNAADNHLAKHDDALAGGTSAETGTALDADCVAAAPAG